MGALAETEHGAFPAAVRQYGDRALLFEFDSTTEVLAWQEMLRDAGLDGVVDVVAAARTVLLELDSPRRVPAARLRLRGLRHGATQSGATPTDPAAHREADVVVDVRYDGADLDDVAAHTGLTRDQVIAAHTAEPMQVGFGGFAPGFAYVLTGDERLRVPRRAEPRTRVPAGAVGLAGEFTGAYPRQSPGGWQLIGHTDAVLWDVERTPPALLAPGSWVRFRAVDDAGATHPGSVGKGAAPS